MVDDLMGGVGLPGSAEAKARRRGYKSAEIERADLVEKIRTQAKRIEELKKQIDGSHAVGFRDGVIAERKATTAVVDAARKIKDFGGVILAECYSYNEKIDFEVFIKGLEEALTCHDGSNETTIQCPECQGVKVLINRFDHNKSVTCAVCKGKGRIEEGE